MSNLGEDDLLGADDEFDYESYDITNEKEEDLLQEEDESSDEHEEDKNKSLFQAEDQDDILNLDVDEDFQDVEDEGKDKIRQNEKFVNERKKNSNCNLKIVNKPIKPQTGKPPTFQTGTTKDAAGKIQRKSSRWRGNTQGNFPSRANYFKHNSQRKRSTVLINPRYEGVVQISDNNARLAWDSSHYSQSNKQNVIQPWANGNIPGSNYQLPPQNPILNIFSDLVQSTQSLLPQPQIQAQHTNYQQQQIFQPPPLLSLPLPFNNQTQFSTWSNSYKGPHENQVNSHKEPFQNQVNSYKGSFQNQVNSCKGPVQNQANSYKGLLQNKANSYQGSQQNQVNSYKGSQQNQANSYKGPLQNNPNSYQGSQQNQASSYKGLFQNQVTTPVFQHLPPQNFQSPPPYRQIKPVQPFNSYQNYNYQSSNQNYAPQNNNQNYAPQQDTKNNFNQSYQNRNTNYCRSNRNEFENFAQNRNLNSNNKFKNDKSNMMVQYENRNLNQIVLQNDTSEISKQGNHRVIIPNLDNRNDRANLGGVKIRRLIGNEAEPRAELPQKKIKVEETAMRTMETKSSEMKNEQTLNKKVETVDEEEDEEMIQYRLKIEEQKKEREKVLRIKEERRMQMLMQRQKKDEDLLLVPPPKAVVQPSKPVQKAPEIQIASSSSFVPKLEPISSSFDFDPDEFSNLTFKVSNNVQHQIISTDTKNTTAGSSSSGFMANRVVVVKNTNKPTSGVFKSEPTLETELPPPPQQEVSSFLTNRTVLKKDNALLNTRLVVINNLAASTTQNKLVALTRGIGEIQKLQLDKQERQATILFKSVASAHAFYKKYQRRILDLSVIDVKLEPL